MVLSQSDIRWKCVYNYSPRVDQYASSCNTRHIPIILWVKKWGKNYRLSTDYSKKSRTNCHVTEAGFSNFTRKCLVITSCLNFWRQYLVWIFTTWESKGNHWLKVLGGVAFKRVKNFIKNSSIFPKTESLLSNRVCFFPTWVPYGWKVKDVYQ